jgi:hypothetical protein
MDQIFGAKFRKPTMTQPLWLRIIFGLLAALFILMTAWWMTRAGEWLWSSWRLPFSRQDLTGRLVALGFGVSVLFANMRRWRMAYYLDPPMRDLVTTPGSHWQIFWLGLRARWNWTGAIFFSFFLYPFFPAEWRIVLPIRNWYLSQVLSIISAVGWSCLGQLFFNLLAIGWNLISAALGFGGAAPQFVIPSMLRPLVLALNWGLVVALGMCLTVLIVQDPGPILLRSTWWHSGELMIAAFNDPNGVAHLLLNHFPSVAYFDAMRSSVGGPSDLFGSAMLGTIAWMIAGLAAIALSCRAGFDMSARATWHFDKAAPKPADSLPKRKPRHDPDEVNGVIEGWLVARFGRMGRSVLRVISAVFDVGAVDRHLDYSIALIPLCLFSGYTLMWLLPDLLDAIFTLFQGQLDKAARQGVQTFSGAICLIVVLVYRMSIWGALRMNVKQPTGSAFNSNWNGGGMNSASGNISFLMVRDSSLPATRGDNRYPLTEIYPIGFSDAVLLPTFYSLLWLSLVGGLSLIEGLLLGLDAETMVWCFVIGVPALTQVCFFAAMGTMVSNWMDYRRAWLASFVRSLAFGICVAFVLLGVVVLIIFLCRESIDHGRPWVAWLGSLNIVLIVDVALYMSARWIYVRRRFDAERRNVRNLG